MIESPPGGDWAELPPIHSSTRLEGVASAAEGIVDEQEGPWTLVGPVRVGRGRPRKNPLLSRKMPPKGSGAKKGRRTGLRSEEAQASTSKMTAPVSRSEPGNLAPVSNTAPTPLRPATSMPVLPGVGEKGQPGYVLVDPADLSAAVRRAMESYLDATFNLTGLFKDLPKRDEPKEKRSRRLTEQLAGDPKDDSDGERADAEEEKSSDEEVLEPRTRSKKKSKSQVKRSERRGAVDSDEDEDEPDEPRRRRKSDEDRRGLMRSKPVGGATEGRCKGDSARKTVEKKEERRRSRETTTEASLWNVARISSSSEDDNGSEDDTDSSLDGRIQKCVKILQSWRLSFSGADKENPEDFLTRLTDCKRNNHMSDRDCLEAIPNIFTRAATQWFRGVMDQCTSWKEFEKIFRRRYVREWDSDDLEDELKRRQQAKGERMSCYLASLRYIVSKFKRPPEARKILKTAYRNLLPEYRHFMIGKTVTSLDDLEKLGRVWEKHLDLDDRYVGPVPKEKMRLPEAGFAGKTARRVAGCEEVATADAKRREEQPKGKGSGPVAAAREEARFKREGEGNIAGGSRNAARLPTAPPAAGNFSGPRFPENPVGRQFAPPTDRNQPPRTPNWSSPMANPVTNQPANAFPSGEEGFWGACRHCNIVGHRAARCPHVRCFECQQPGHRVPECPRLRCYNCQQPGHLSRNCPNRAAARPPSPTYQRPPRMNQVPVVGMKPVSWGNELAGGQSSPMPPGPRN